MALRRFVVDIKSGRDEVEAPTYSHLTYDIVPGSVQEVRRPELMIFEGLNVLHTAQRQAGRALAVFSFIETGGLLTLTLDGELCMARTLGVSQTVLDIEGMDSVLERLTLEIQRSLDHFDRQFGGIPVDQLLLAPMERAEGLRNGLAGNLALPVKVIDLAAVLDIAALPDANALSPHCFHAIGAALRMEETTP